MRLTILKNDPMTILKDQIDVNLKDETLTIRKKEWRSSNSHSFKKIRLFDDFSNKWNSHDFKNEIDDSQKWDWTILKNEIDDSQKWDWRLRAKMRL